MSRLRYYPHRGRRCSLLAKCKFVVSFNSKERNFIVKIQSPEDCTRALQFVCDSDYADGTNAQQVNCKGDKIENIDQLLMHLGMDDIKNKCDDCDIETRCACLEKQNQSDKLNSDEQLDKQLDDNTMNERLLNERQCPEHNLLLNKWPSDIKRKVESKLILSSIFASLCVVAITFQ